MKLIKDFNNSLRGNHSKFIPDTFGISYSKFKIIKGVQKSTQAIPLLDAS